VPTIRTQKWQKIFITASLTRWVRQNDNENWKVRYKTVVQYTHYPRDTRSDPVITSCYLAYANDVFVIDETRWLVASWCTVTAVTYIQLRFDQNYTRCRCCGIVLVLPSIYNLRLSPWRRRGQKTVLSSLERKYSDCVWGPLTTILFDRNFKLIVSFDIWKDGRFVP